MSAAAVSERDLRDVQFADRIERAVDLGAFDSVYESPRLAVLRAFGELVADLAAIGGGVVRGYEQRGGASGGGECFGPDTQPA